MSQLLNNPAQPLYSRNNESIQTVGWVTVSDIRPINFGYRSPFWPRGNRLIGDTVVDLGILDSIAWGEYEIVGGVSSRVAFIGVTKDEFSSPLGNCVVQLFRTSDDLFIMETTSDASGNFFLQSWYSPDQHYIVGYKPGSPDATGATVNTLVGV